MTRVYISGPVTGIPNYRDPFDKEEGALREAGNDVFNPANLPMPAPDLLVEWEEEGKLLNDPDTQKRNLWQYFMRICVGQIPLCDEMRMLPHWERSKGAVWEHRIAQMLGLRITYVRVPD